MPKTERDPLGEGFDWRLRAELNRIQPRFSSPRYLSPDAHRIGTWRLAPAGLALGIIGILGLSAYAATGSANPVVWTQRIVTTIEPNVVEPPPTPTSNPTPTQRGVAPAATQGGDEPSPRAEPSERAEPSPPPWSGEFPESSPGADEHTVATATSDSGIEERF
jgi:hypothetical protein